MGGREVVRLRTIMSTDRELMGGCDKSSVATAGSDTSL